MGWVIFQENKKKQKRNNEGVENHSTSILSTKVKKKKVKEIFTKSQNKT